MTDLLLLLPFGLAIGLSLGLLGGGGSILTVPVLVYVFRLDAKSAVATSLVVVGVVSLVGALRHARHGQVDAGAAAGFGVLGIVGASLGSRVAAHPAVSGRALLIAFALLMVVVAGLMLRHGAPGVRTAPPPPRRAARLAVAGFGTGLLTGALGVGGGFLILPALLLVGGLGMHRAIGTSLVVIGLNCIAGVLGFSARVPVAWGLASGFVVAGAAGSILGARWARRTDPRHLRRGFGVLVFLLGAVMLVDQAARSWSGRG